MTKIVLENVTKVIRGNTVTDNVSVVFESGEIIGLKGVNGSGKTMLMRLIAGLILPTGGRILIDGEELGTATVTFDAANVKTGYTYVLSTSTDKTSWSDATELTAAQAAAGTVSITLDAPVKYLKLKVVK